MEDSISSAIEIPRTQLPIARVKKIFRLDPNCATISTEAVQLLTLATEHFIGLLAKVAYGQAVFDKRKTLQLKDLEFCVKNYEPFGFLDGTLDGWPENRGGKHGSNVAMTAILDAANNEQEDLNVDDVIFDFDKSLEEAGPSFDDQIVETLDNAENVQNTEIIENVVPEIQSLKQKVFGHYGYCFPMNLTFQATLNQTVEAEADLMRDKERDDEMEIDQHIMIC